MPRLLFHPSPTVIRAALVLLFTVHIAIRSGAAQDVPAPVRALLQRLCFDCHSGDSVESGLNVQTLVSQNDFA